MQVSTEQLTLIRDMFYATAVADVDLPQFQQWLEQQAPELLADNWQYAEADSVLVADIVCLAVDYELPLMQFLLGKGLPAGLSNGHFMPIHRAVMKRRLDMLETLIAEGAQLEAVSEYEQMTAMQYAVSLPGAINMVRCLQKHQANLDVLNEQQQSLAFLAADYPILKLLLNAGVDALQRDCYGNTLLHYHHGIGAVELLLQKQIAVNTPNFFAETPLHKTYLRPVAYQLVQAGADVTALAVSRDSRLKGVPCLSPLVAVLSYCHISKFGSDAEATLRYLLVDAGADPYPFGITVEDQQRIDAIRVRAQGRVATRLFESAQVVDDPCAQLSKAMTKEIDLLLTHDQPKLDLIKILLTLKRALYCDVHYIEQGLFNKDQLNEMSKTEGLSAKKQRVECLRGVLLSTPYIPAKRVLNFSL